MQTPILMPAIGARPGRGLGRFLMICFYDPHGIPTVYENIANWQALSRFRIEVLNLWPGRGSTLRLPSTLDLSAYSGIIIHCAVAYSPENLFSLDQSLRRPFEEYDGLKILMKQDEHVQTKRFAEFIGKKKFDIVITCVPPKEVPKVYPSEVVGNVDFIHALTGYVSPALRALKRQRLSERSLDISYRGSIQPLEFGRLGYEKRGIGFDMAAAANGAALSVDISSRWEDRIGGNAWFDFLGRSKIVLGAESGSNLFDFTGTVAEWCRSFEVRNTGTDRTSKEYYLKAHEEYLHSFEGNVNYAQVSPRHFEATACGAAQILYEGEYSGIFKPDQHFMPLKRDLSNLTEVLDFARNDQRIKEFAERAYEEIIGNSDNHYEHYVQMFDDAVESRIEQKGPKRNSRLSRNPVDKVPKALLLVPHEPTLDPRIDWFSIGLSAQFEVCEIGLYVQGSTETVPSIEKLSDRRTRVRVDGSWNRWNFVPPRGGEAGDGLGLPTLSEVALIGEVPRSTLCYVLGALDATDEDLNRFRGLCRYFVNVNTSLLESARRIGGFDVVVAADLHALPAAVALTEEYDVPLVYDAHEFWPYSIPELRHWEVEFWAAVERTLLKRVALSVTVSPQLANAMARHYGHKFVCVPNCASLGEEEAIDLQAALNGRARSPDVIFLVQGGIALHRGFEKLIKAWDKVDSRAKLWLRGPDNPFKSQMIELARRKGLLDRSVFFPQPVSEAELVKAARDADIGIIPYEPSSINNRYCSPNKLSQYMAAGLPIICNELDFVKSIVIENGIGSSVDFNDEAALVRTIDYYVINRQSIPELSRKAQQAFVRSFNWQVASRDLYRRIKELVPGSKPAEFDFGWINDLGQAFPAREPSAHEHELEINRAEIARLNKVYTEEISRLNKIYPTEIKSINKMYMEEIGRLHSVYRTELERVSRYSVLRFIPRQIKTAAKAILRRSG
jgi:glycosyltransferase involved in cell wall biosynthesis